MSEAGNFFEDFVVGQVYVHDRGRTISEYDNLRITHMTMNTAQSHFNRPYAQQMMGGTFARDMLVMGGCTLSFVVGLTSQDMSEHSLADVGLDDITLEAPVFPGDTLFAESVVVEVRDSDRVDCGELRYRFTGRNQDGAVIAQGTRAILVRRRPTAADSTVGAA